MATLQAQRQGAHTPHFSGWSRRKIAVAAVGFLITAAVLFIILFPARLLHILLVHQGGDLFGRDFAIDGPADLSWRGFDPVIHAEQIRIGNMEGGEAADMLRIGRLDLRIELGKLLFGKLSMPYLYVDNFNLSLEKNAKGEKNWDFPAFSQGEAVTDAALPDDRGDFPVIGVLRIRGGHVMYRDDTKKLSLDLAIDRATGRDSSDEEGLKFTGTGKLQGKPLTVAVTGGSVTMLRDTSRDYPLDLDLKMGDTHVALKGTFSDPVKMKGINAALSLQGHNLADLFYLTEIPLPPTPPYRLSGTLKKTGTVWGYEPFTGRIGDSDMKGSLAYDTRGERNMLTGELISNYLDMDDLGGFIGIAPGTGAGETAAPEQKAEARRERARARLLPDVPIDLKRLRASDLDVRLKANRVDAKFLPIDSIDARFDLDNGLLRIDPLKMGLSGGQAEGSLILDGRKDMPVVTNDVVLKNISLKGFFDNTRFESLSSGRFGGKIDLTGHGRSLARVLGTSDGNITAIMSGGTISLLLIEAAGIDIAEAAPLLLGSDRTTDIRCAVGDFKVSDGILSSRNFVFDTTDTNLNGTAHINLRRETIRAEIEAHPKDKSIFAARTPLLVDGSLKNPSVGLDPGELGARTGIATALGFLMPPLAILPFIETGGGENANCRALIAQAQSHGGK